MHEERITRGSSWSDPLRQVMNTPDDVALRLRACGWGLKRIARELGCSHHMVKGYVAAGGVPCQPRLRNSPAGADAECFDHVTLFGHSIVRCAALSAIRRARCPTQVRC